MTELKIPIVTTGTISAEEFRNKVKGKWDVPKTLPKFAIGDIVSWKGFWGTDDVGMVIAVKQNVSGWGYEIVRPRLSDGMLERVGENEFKEVRDKNGDKQRIDILTLVDKMDPEDW